MTLKEKIIEAKVIQTKLDELELKYSKYRSSKVLKTILELRQRYIDLTSQIHS